MDRSKVISYFSAQAINGNWASLYDPSNPISYSFIQRFIKTINLMQPIHGNILDMGCGTGILEKVVVENNAKYIGFDGSKEMIEACNKKFSEDVANGKAHFEFSDSKNFKTSISIDCAVGMGYLEYFEKPDECLEEAKKLLKDGGKLILSFPHKNSLDNLGLLVLTPFRKLATYLTGKNTPQPPRKYWEKNEAADLFKRNGFIVSKIVFYNTNIIHYPFTRFTPKFANLIASLIEKSFLKRIPFLSTGFIICATKN